ncbi:MAG: TMEM175 family protein [Kangiellaceae bacterium]|nr:TMEM175 family protein [Kangiellaceae bacterium]MCW9016666.1 TMEM175 family protein [Kangiellaceae bacterium]
MLNRQPLKRAFIESCPRENGFIIRGENMTRVETFVDAAFAFALTMLVISLDEIPKSPAELLVASRDLPAFLASGLQVGFIWYQHSLWSRRFGLEDKVTIFLSLALVMLVLVFIYPLKLVFMGLFAWLSDGYLSPGLGSMSLKDLTDLFVYFAIGFVCLAGIFIGFYRNTLKHSDYLRLTPFEAHECRTEIGVWVILLCVAVLSGILAKTLPGLWAIAAGFTYALLGIIEALYYRNRKLSRPTP